jgi:hypothetical protein
MTAIRGRKVLESGSSAQAALGTSSGGCITNLRLVLCNRLHSAILFYLPFVFICDSSLSAIRLCLQFVLSQNCSYLPHFP